MSFIVAVDAGGTFSDCVVIDAEGHITTGKAPSTPGDYAQGILNAVGAAAAQLGLSVSQLLERAVLFGHGTTVATNTLLTKTGCRTGFITTRGHEDTIIIGRIFQKVAGLSEREITDVSGLKKPRPLVPKHLIVGVNERIDYKGSVVVLLTEAEIAQRVETLVAAGVAAIAVNLLWSFKNPTHEQAIKAYIERHHPGLFVTLSTDLVPVIKEYERGITTVINAYLSQRVLSYLRSLRDQLKAHGLRHPPVVMQSSGGVISIEKAWAKSVALLTSGPAGGVIGARALGQVLGHDSIITSDVGGTSFDVGLIVDGEQSYSETPIFAQYHIALPVIDVASIGAGGGSIAWIEAATGILRVGPQSAGADPGPACYGLGGTEPTVTDANLVLGRINPDYFLGGQRALEAEKAREAVGRLADALGMDLEQTAMGIIDIVNSQMADLIRKVTIERGYDPKKFVLYAFGGAGPLHVGAYGRGLGVREAVIPSFASEFSAFGIAGSDVVTVHDRSDPMYVPLDLERLNRIYQELELATLQELKAHGIPDEDIYFVRYMRLRYRGQVHEVRTPVDLGDRNLRGGRTHEVRTPVPGGRIDEEHVRRVVARFEGLYEQRYGKGAAYREPGIQALTYHVHGYGRLHAPALQRQERGDPDPSAAQKATRHVYFHQSEGWVSTPIFASERLRAGHRLEGPAVIEAPDTTVYIHPGQHATVDEYRNLILTL